MSSTVRPLRRVAILTLGCKLNQPTNHITTTTLGSLRGDVVEGSINDMNLPATALAEAS